MYNRQNIIGLFNILCLSLLTVMFFSCGSNERYFGKYIADHETDPGAPKQVIELKEKGIGNWQTVDDKVTFTWNVKKDEMRLHFKPSGIIVGKIHNDKIEIKLPGSKFMVFKKSIENINK